MKSITIGVAGGSGSGKTTVALSLLEKVGLEHIAYISHDSYYCDPSISLENKMQLNWDHPNAFDNELLAAHLIQLQSGNAIKVPIYDYKNYARAQETREVAPQQIILIDGILLFVDKKLRDLMDIKIFVDTDADLRFIRRMQRDIVERGRSQESVTNQYLQSVRPMHLEFVEPSKRYADLIIPEGGYNAVAIELVAARINALLGDK